MWPGCSIVLDSRAARIFDEESTGRGELNLLFDGREPRQLGQEILAVVRVSEPFRGTSDASGHRVIWRNEFDQTARCKTDDGMQRRGQRHAFAEHQVVQQCEA